MLLPVQCVCVCVGQKSKKKSQEIPGILEWMEVVEGLVRLTRFEAMAPRVLTAIVKGYVVLWCVYVCVYVRVCVCFYPFTDRWLVKAFKCSAFSLWTISMLTTWWSMDRPTRIPGKLMWSILVNVLEKKRCCYK